MDVSLLEAVEALAISRSLGIWIVIIVIKVMIMVVVILDVMVCHRITWILNMILIHPSIERNGFSPAS